MAQAQRRIGGDGPAPEHNVVGPTARHLDRIGQRHTVQIHLPYYESSATAVLARWYDDGIGAFERNCPAAQTLFEYFSSDLRRSLQQPTDQLEIEALILRTQRKTAETLLELKRGRDRLLELNSFDESSAEQIVDRLIEEEHRHKLSSYMEQLFDEFGVEQEHHSSSSLILRPGDHMLVHSFPALPQEGLTATFQRDMALSREDMQFLTWEHPMVVGAMDMVLSGEFGNTAFCTIKLAPLKSGTILLEAIFTLSCTAPSELQLSRYLPLTPVRIVVDNQHVDMSKIMSSQLINRLGQKAPRSSARELLQHTRPKITSMIGEAKQLAESQREGIIAHSARDMHTSLDLELKRLRNLAQVNSNIRPQEIEHLEAMSEQLQTYLDAAQMRLDALRVVMVTA